VEELPQNAGTSAMTAVLYVVVLVMILVPAASVVNAGRIASPAVDGLDVVRRSHERQVGAGREVQKLERQERMREWKARGKSPEEIIKLEVGIYMSTPPIPTIHAYTHTIHRVYVVYNNLAPTYLLALFNELAQIIYYFRPPLRHSGATSAKGVENGNAHGKHVSWSGVECSVIGLPGDVDV